MDFIIARQDITLIRPSDISSPEPNDHETPKGANKQDKYCQQLADITAHTNATRRHRFCACCLCEYRVVSPKRREKLFIAIATGLQRREKLVRILAEQRKPKKKRTLTHTMKKNIVSKHI